MFNPSIALIAAMAVMTGFAPSSATAQETPEIKINKIRAFGKGCRSDINGKPLNWRYTVNQKLRQLSLEFDEFIVDDQIKDRRSDCQIKINVAYPAGKTLFVYESQVFGEAEIVDEDEGEIKTLLTLPSVTYPMSDPLVLKSGHDGRWKTKVQLYPGVQDAPCGGDDYPIVYHIFARMKGDSDSLLQVQSKEGRFTNLKFRLADCDTRKLSAQAR